MGSKRDRNKDGRRRGQPRDSSSLAQHKRVGNKVKPRWPRWRTTFREVARLVWLRDDLPNHLWALGHLALDIDGGLHTLNRAMREMRDVLLVLGYDEPITGTLLSFEAVPEPLRPELLAALDVSGTYEEYFTVEWAKAISLYDEAPRRWTAALHLERGLRPDADAGRRWLGAAIEAGSHGQSLAATRAKMVVLVSMAIAGKLLNFPRDVWEVGTRYPTITEDERSKFEPTMRSMYGAFADLQDDIEGAAVQWAQRFWRSNWRRFGCEPVDQVVPKAPDIDDTDLEDRRKRVVAYFRDRVDGIGERFRKLLNCDPDLYNPDRYEVLTGLAARAIRQAHTAVRTPVLWTSDLGSWLLRSSVETKIVMAWLEQAGGDIYAGYKDYGRGRLKLLKLHVERYIEEQGDAVDPAVHDYLETLTAEVNQDVWEEWQSISIEKTFSGVNARAMAIEVGLKDDYDLAFAPASGTAHGDWVALDRLSLTRCANHRWHRIGRSSMRQVLDPELLDSVLDYVDDVVVICERALGTAGNDA